MTYACHGTERKGTAGQSLSERNPLDVRSANESAVLATNEDLAVGVQGDDRWSCEISQGPVTERSNAATEERLKSGHAVGGLSIV